MTTLLLDYRWNLEAVLNDPDVTFAVIGFLKLLSRTELRPAPFIEEQQINTMWDECKPGPDVHWQAWDALDRFFQHCTRPAGSICIAKPSPEPPDILDSWRRALRDQLDNPADWRNPQIIVPRQRRTDWPPENEVHLTCEPCGNHPASGPYQRVLAVLEEYDSHPFALLDHDDPWSRLKSKYCPALNARNGHPCVLPKPPILNQVRLEDLVDRLDEARRQGWCINGKYYYIPRADWRPESINKTQWREGYVFPHKSIPGWNGPVLIDFQNREWRWDMQERHWDVQTEPYISVKHTGEQL